MDALCKRDYLDLKKGAVIKSGSLVSMSEARFKQVNAAFPGTLERVAKKKAVEDGER